MGQVNLVNRTPYFQAIFALTVGCMVFTSGIESQSDAQDAFDTVIDVSGKFKEINRNVLTLTRDDGTDFFVALHEDPTRLLFSATAKPEWIRVGMMVRIQANFGPQGAPLAAIDSVELLEPFQAPKASQHLREQYAPGVYPLDEKPENPQNQAAGFRPGNYRVVGPITGMDRTGIMVNAGQTRVQLPIAADAKWLIRFHSLSLAEPGDLVTVNGFHKPPDETHINANVVNINVDRVYEPTVKQRPKKKTRAAADKEKEAPKTQPE